MPLYDSMVSADVIPEKRDWFFTVNHLFSLKLLNDIHPIFAAFYLRKVGQSSTLFNELFAIAQSTVKSITVSKTTSVDEFISSGCLAQWLSKCYFKHKCPRGKTCDDLLEKPSQLKLWKELLKGHASEYSRVLSVCLVHDHNITQHVRPWEGFFKTRNYYNKTQKSVKVW